MKDEAKAASDIEVQADETTLKKLLIRAVLITLMPPLLSLGWLVAIREPNMRNNSAESVAQSITQAKASLISSYVSDLVAQVDAITATIEPGATETSLREHALTPLDGVGIILIPLDEMGTINLTPGTHGISSHIGVDLIRRAFAGEKPPPEVVLKPQNTHVLIARTFGEPAAGVVLAELSNQRISDLVESTNNEGSYQLVQTLSRGNGPVIAGNLSEQKALASAAVDGTAWRLEFAPNDDWLSDILPGWSGILAVLVMTLSAGAIGLGVLVTGLSRILQRDTHAILASTDNKAPLKLDISALIPIAKMLRQLSHKSRRQVVTRVRQSVESAEQASQNPEQNITDDARVMSTSSPTADVVEIDDETAEDRGTSDDGLPDHIFLNDCIRGIADTELTDDMVGKIAAAIAALADDRDIQALAVGHDARPSSARIRTKLVKTLLACGKDVVDIGQVPLALAHYATHNSATQSCIMITGGNAGQSVNGFKIIFNQTLLAGSDIQDILATIRSGRRPQGSGRTAKQDLAPAYIDNIALDIVLPLPLKVVIDCDFGSGAHVVSALFEVLDCELLLINQPQDGVEPDDRLLSTSLEELGKRVREEQADIGLLFDNGGDGIHTVTETGRAVDNDLLLMLLARDVLERHPGANIVYDVKFTQHFGPFIARAGGGSLITSSGPAFVREKMLETGAILGGDFDGHIFFSERWHGLDDALYTAARLLEVLAAASASYDMMVDALPQSISTPELFLATDKATRQKLMRKLTTTADFPGARITTLDGLRLDYPDGWGLVRNASNEGALSMRFEGQGAKGLKHVQAIFREAIAKEMPDLELPF